MEKLTAGRVSPPPRQETGAEIRGNKVGRIILENSPKEKRQRHGSHGSHVNQSSILVNRHSCGEGRRGKKGGREGQQGNSEGEESSRWPWSLD